MTEHLFMALMRTKLYPQRRQQLIEVMFTNPSVPLTADVVARALVLRATMAHFYCQPRFLIVDKVL